jgi:membrane protein
VGPRLGSACSAAPAIFLFLFWRLPKVQSPFRRCSGRGARGRAVRGAQAGGALYIERTTENPLYGSFAVIVGLLVWINIVSRMLLICAAWTVTAPYDSDIEPSGTANARAAREAGIPEEFADNDPDDPPTLQEDGAPSRWPPPSRAVRRRRTSRRAGAARPRPVRPTAGGGASRR